MAPQTEPIGSIPGRSSLIEAAPGSESRRISQAELLSEDDSTVQDAVVRFGEIRLQVVRMANSDGKRRRCTPFTVQQTLLPPEFQYHRGWHEGVVTAHNIGGDPATIASCRGR